MNTLGSATVGGRPMKHDIQLTASAHIEVDPGLLDPQQASTPSSTALPSTPIAKKRKHHLSAQKDRLLGEIRDLNFAIVGSRLSKLARRLEGDYGGVKNLKSVSQMKDFVGKLGGLQSEQQNLRLRELAIQAYAGGEARGGRLMTRRHRVDRAAHAYHQDRRVQQVIRGSTKPSGGV
jgi:hypothetical protein